MGIPPISSRRDRYVRLARKDCNNILRILSQSLRAFQPDEANPLLQPDTVPDTVPEAAENRGTTHSTTYSTTESLAADEAEPELADFDAGNDDEPEERDPMEPPPRTDQCSEPCHCQGGCERPVHLVDHR